MHGLPGRRRSYPGIMLLQSTCTPLQAAPQQQSPWLDEQEQGPERTGPSDGSPLSIIEGAYDYQACSCSAVTARMRLTTPPRHARPSQLIAHSMGGCFYRPCRRCKHHRVGSEKQRNPPVFKTGSFCLAASSYYLHFGLALFHGT